MIGYSAEAYGNAAQRLRGAMSKLLNFRGMLESMGSNQAMSMRSNIARQQSPDGTPFEPLKRPHKDGSTTVLYDTGEMFRDIRYVVGHDDVTVGSTKLYAVFQQRGFVVLSFWQGTVPRTTHVKGRPFSGISADEDRPMHQRVAYMHCLDAFGRAA